jgi:isopenicillin-N epimerase
MGIGPDVCCARNPRLVYGRLTGYGQDGPLAHKAGHDIDYLAIAGALEPLGRVDGPPTAPINVLADFAGGGLLLAYGIALALFERGTTGVGQVIDAAMIDGAALLMAPFYSGRASGGWGPRGTNMLDGAAPFYDVYECADRKWLAIGAIEPQFYAALVEGLGLAAELGPSATSTGQWDIAHWPEHKQRVAVAVAQRTRDEWVAVFDGVDACVAPVLDPVEAIAHPHNVARNMFDGTQPRAAPRFCRSRASDDIWPLDPSVTFLNHGSFGSCPRPVLEYQSQLRARLEAEPIRFLIDEFDPMLDAARETVADFVGTDADDLVFVTNATTAVNTVIRSLSFAAGDELLTTSHAYNACANALHYVAERSGASVVVADVPFPVPSAGAIVDAILAAATPRTRFALIDHITSPTGIIFPIEHIIGPLIERGIDVMIDGAHAPGMIPLDVDSLGATFYTGNLHKWVCAPKGAAFLWVPRSRQLEIRPLTISHGANEMRAGRSRFQTEFAWQGTDDPTAWLSVAKALEVVGALDPAGWPGVMAFNHELALQARDILAAALGVAPPVPDAMIGSLVSLPLPADTGDGSDLHDWLWTEHRIEMPVMTWPGSPRRLMRVSSQRYNRVEQYEQLASALQRRYPRISG